MWGDISDDQYVRERQGLQREIDGLRPRENMINVTDLERGADLLKDLPQLWSHPGATDHQREALVKELLVQAKVSGANLVAIQPKSIYQPLFAYVVTEGVVGWSG